MSETARIADPLLLPYRSCVGIMLINVEGLIWVGRRRHGVAQDGESWQMPQGGIDEGEAPDAAAFRELAEETGTDKAEIIGETSGWLHYDLPPAMLGVALYGKYRGQKQKWFAMRFIGSDTDFNIHHPPHGVAPEFDDWRWVQGADLAALIVPFKRNVYEAVLTEFHSLIR